MVPAAVDPDEDVQNLVRVLVGFQVVVDRPGGAERLEQVVEALVSELWLQFRVGDSARGYLGEHRRARVGHGHHLGQRIPPVRLAGHSHGFFVGQEPQVIAEPELVGIGVG